MKISCEIIKDLLPLYYDGICGNDSKALVEEHLTSCDSCKVELQAMEDALPINKTEQNLKEAEAVQKLSMIWKKGMLKSLLNGIFSTILIIALFILFLFIFIFMGIKVVPKL